MAQQHYQRAYINDDQTWNIYEPGYGFGPLQPFKAAYEVEGVSYKVIIQGFFKGDVEGHDTFRYRVLYDDGAQRILKFTLDNGFEEEDGGKTDHAQELAKCIEEHFLQ